MNNPSSAYTRPATSCLPLPFPVCLLPHSSHPTNAGCFRMGANSFFGSTPSRIAARHMPGVKPGAQAWEACMLPLHYRRHDTSQETRQWLLAIAPLPCLLSLSKRFTHPAPWPSFTALEGPLPKFAIMCSKQAHVHDKVHLHQPGNEPGSHRRRRCILPLDH